MYGDYTGGSSRYWGTEPSPSSPIRISAEASEVQLRRFPLPMSTTTCVITTAVITVI